MAVAGMRDIQNPFIAMLKLRFKFALHSVFNTPEWRWDASTQTDRGRAR